MAADETRCCATCGFMGLKRPSSGSDPLGEAGEHYQDNGVCDLGKYDGAPHCHKGAADLPIETNAAAQRITDGRRGNGHRPDAVLEVLQTPRSGCPWTKRRPGYSPKEHDMILAEQMALEAQVQSADAMATSSRALSMIAELQNKYLEWTQRQADKDEKFAMRIQALEETRHQETRSDANAFSKREIQTLWWTAILSAAAAIVAAIVTVVFAIK